MGGEMLCAGVVSQGRVSRKGVISNVGCMARSCTSQRQHAQAAPRPLTPPACSVLLLPLLVLCVCVCVCVSLQALLYLVPCTLGVVLLLAVSRGELHLLLDAVLEPQEDAVEVDATGSDGAAADAAAREQHVALLSGQQRSHHADAGQAVQARQVA